MSLGLRVALAAAVGLSMAAPVPVSAQAIGRSSPQVPRPQPMAMAVRVTAREGTWLAVDLSPDGRLIAFDLLGQIWTLPAAGGEAKALTSSVADTADDEDPAFAADGRSVFFAGERAGHEGIWQVEIGSRRVRRVTTPPFRDDQPAPSPDGRSLAFVRAVTRVDGERTTGYLGLYVLDLAGGALRPLPFGDGGVGSVLDPAWSTDGRTIYVVAARPPLPATPRGGPIWAVDVASGRAYRVSDSTLVAFCPAPAPDGRTLAYIARDSSSRWQLWLRDLGLGTEHRITDEAELTPRRVRWSRDGSALLYVAGGRVRRLTVAQGQSEEIPFVAALEFSRATPTLPQLHYARPGSLQPARGQLGLALSPDARRFAMLALGRLWVVPVGGRPRAVAAVPEGARDLDWAPSQDRVAYSVGSWGEENIVVTELASGRSYAVTSMPGREILPRWSPDGRHLAFVREPHDSAERLLVLPAAAREVSSPAAATDLGEVDVQEWAVGLAGALAPAWTPDARALLVVHAPDGPFQREPFRALRPTRSELVSLDGQARPLKGTPLQPTYVRWTDDSTVVFLSADRAWRARVSRSAGAWAEPEPLGDDAAAYLSAARNGQALYVSSDGLRMRGTSGAVRRLGWPVSFRVPDPGTLLVRNARVLDGSGSPPSSPRDLLLRGGVIARIAPVGAIRVKGVPSLDAGGGIVMPGLADLHFHYDGPEQLRGLLYNGVTVIRDQGSDIATLTARRDGQAAGIWPAPRISFGAFQMYTDWPASDGLQQGLEPERDPGQIGRAVALLTAHGAEHMKIRTFHGWTGNVRLIEAAHRAGLRTTGHCILPLPLIAAGMDAKEHLGNTCDARFNAPLHDDVVQLLRATRVVVDATTIAYSWWQLWLDDRGILARPDVAPFLPALKRNATFPAAESNPDYWVREQGRTMLEQTRTLHSAGIPLGLGTDAPELPWGVHLELERLVAAGLTPLEAIRAGTLNAARILGHDAEAGTVEAGKLADLLVLEPAADPSRDIRDTRRIRYVIQGGRLVDREALRHPAAAAVSARATNAWRGRAPGTSPDIRRRSSRPVPAVGALLAR